MIHYTHDYMQQDLHLTTIELVGVGGTGSLILTRLARMDFALKELGFPGLQVKAYDFDEVEINNIGRQNFTMSDLGENKAEILIEKINLAYGLRWEAFNKKYSNIHNANILITCVDNVKTREEIQKKFRKKKKLMNCDQFTNFYWLDTGNGKNFGQIILGSHKITQPKSKYETVAKLPTVIEKFGDLKKFDNEEVQGIEGCSFASSINKQDLFINDIIACHACDLLWKLLKDKYITMNGTVVNLEKGISKGISISL